MVMYRYSSKEQFEKNTPDPPIYSCRPLPKSDNIRADLEATAGRPDLLLANGSAGAGSVDHPAGPHVDADVGDLALAVTASSPEQQITGLGILAGNVLAHLGVVLGLSRAGWKDVSQKINGRIIWWDVCLRMVFF